MESSSKNKSVETQEIKCYNMRRVGIQEQESDLMTALEVDFKYLREQQIEDSNALYNRKMTQNQNMMQEWVITVVLIKRCCILKRDVDQSDAWVIVFLCEVQPRRVGYKSVSGHRNLGVPSPSFAEFVTEDEG
ncbi:hypothetical protein E3N88_32238 [Mikania micrantha]|uniref:Uncharacterized protein n=1 Tax=Mikania micrantha TaxID=192012 RepID=A0A5N6M7W3_9ASTR|nr:hypothetical protein E3N88_32238 [Mikania micrantha]